jgi:hypothetical protein
MAKVLTSIEGIKKVFDINAYGCWTIKDKQGTPKGSQVDDKMTLDASFDKLERTFDILPDGVYTITLKSNSRASAGMPSYDFLKGEDQPNASVTGVSSHSDPKYDKLLADIDQLKADKVKREHQDQLDDLKYEYEEKLEKLKAEKSVPAKIQEWMPIVNGLKGMLNLNTPATAATPMLGIGKVEDPAQPPAPATNQPTTAQTDSQLYITNESIVAHSRITTEWTRRYLNIAALGLNPIEMADTIIAWYKNDPEMAKSMIEGMKQAQPQGA